MKRRCAFQKMTLVTILLLAAPVCLSAPCDTENQIFRPLLGVWEEYRVSNTDRELLGTLSTELVAGGCAIRQSFYAPDGLFSFSSLGFAESPDSWFETYVLSNGQVASYRWRGEGDELILARVTVGSEPLRRLRIFELQPDSYFVVDEESQDGGKTWLRRELVITIRKQGTGE